MEAGGCAGSKLRKASTLKMPEALSRALESLSEIPSGEAFRSFRMAKRATSGGVIPLPTTTSTTSAAAAAASPQASDLSAVQSGVSASGLDKFPSTPVEECSSHESEVDASAGLSEPSNGTPGVASSQSEAGQASGRRPAMATWDYDEITEDGGVSLMFPTAGNDGQDYDDVYKWLTGSGSCRVRGAGMPGSTAADLDAIAADVEATGFDDDGVQDEAKEASRLERVRRRSVVDAAIRAELLKSSSVPAATILDAAITGDWLAAPPLVEQSSAATPGDPEDTFMDRSRSIRVDFIHDKITPITIVMVVVGTRGDVQPFIGIGLKLQEYGHRVRLATHEVFREFVTSFGLEFYPVGGDPRVLSEFVVKHRGILPGIDLPGVLQQRAQLRQIIYSVWGACTDPDPEDEAQRPFTAEAIVTNPAAYGTTLCAEKLNVPLHAVFTMPWTPTMSFPHPFSRIKTDIGRPPSSKAMKAINWLSYFAVGELAWIGMSHFLKDLRKNVLGLRGWGKDYGPHAFHYCQVPWSYIWSPSLVPRPRDWPDNCEVVGFVNLDLKDLTNFEPDAALREFMDAGPPPVFIGFGSLVVNNPKKLTKRFLKALKAAGLRGILQRGWAGLGKGVEDEAKLRAEGALFIGSVPHDWLFEKCCAVVHHGGAGTTAAGLLAGKPTFIVPFFGDQPFWGSACAAAGVGPAPVPIDNLTTDRIVRALKQLSTPECCEAAKKMQERMSHERGADAAVDHLHRTIYGALLAGRSFKWMTPDPEEEPEEASDEDLGAGIAQQGSSSVHYGETSSGRQGSSSGSNLADNGSVRLSGRFLGNLKSMKSRLGGLIQVGVKTLTPAALIPNQP